MKREWITTSNQPTNQPDNNNNKNNKLELVKKHEPQWLDA